MDYSLEEIREHIISMMQQPYPADHQEACEFDTELQFWCYQEYQALDRMYPYPEEQK
jgi:hypothetical protein